MRRARRTCVTDRFWAQCCGVPGASKQLSSKSASCGGGGDARQCAELNGVGGSIPFLYFVIPCNIMHLYIPHTIWFEEVSTRNWIKKFSYGYRVTILPNKRQLHGNGGI